MNRGWVWWEECVGREEEDVCACVCVCCCMYMCRGKEEKRDQNCPSANQKTQLSSSISVGETQRAALTQWISGLDQNNYYIISSSDDPRLIQPGFACRIALERKKNARLWASAGCSHHAGRGSHCAGDWEMGISVPGKNGSTSQKWREGEEKRLSKNWAPSPCKTRY